MKIYSFGAFYVLHRWTHLFARLVILKERDGLTIDGDFSFARGTKCDIAACALSQTFWNEMIEIYDD